MRNLLLGLMAGATLAGISAPAVAEKADKVVVDQYRDKIAAARADPVVGKFGGSKLDEATAALPELSKDLDDNKPERVKATMTRIDALIASARTSAETAATQARTQQAISANRADVADAQARAEAAKADAARAQADAAQARNALAAMQMKQTALGATLVLQDVVFQTGKADLKPGADARLRPLAAYLKSNPAVKVQIDGHTDSQGADTYNQQLSQARAAAVAVALGAMGVDPARVHAIGHGESQPVASNLNAAGRQQNRRVEITLLGQQVGGTAAAAM